MHARRSYLCDDSVFSTSFFILRIHILILILATKKIILYILFYMLYLSILEFSKHTTDRQKLAVDVQSTVSLTSWGPFFFFFFLARRLHFFYMGLMPCTIFG